MPRIIDEYPSLFQDLERIALDSEGRMTRAQRATDRILREGRFRRVGVYDLSGDGMARLLAESEMPEASEEDPAETVPVCSLNGAVVGTLEAHVDPGAPLAEEDRLRLAACAGVLWWLWME
jgi:predicted GNAT family acetyltransferase